VLVPLLIGMPVDTRMGFGALKLPIDPNRSTRRSTKPCFR
jgi:hypothetical protein